MKSKIKKLLPPNRLEIIECRSIVIKPISSNEINQQYIGWLNDHNINQFLDVRYNTQTESSIIAYINGVRLKKGCEVYAIFTKKENIHIGNMSITEYNFNNRYAVFGIMIGNLRSQQLGLGGQAMVLLMEYFFNDSGIMRVECGAIADNLRSCKTLEYLGFKKEGVLRNRSVLTSGKITDVYPYGLLRQDWEQQRKVFIATLRSMKIIKSKGC